MEIQPRMVKSTNNSGIAHFATFSNLSYLTYFIKDARTCYMSPSSFPKVHYYGSNIGRDRNEERKSSHRDRRKSKGLDNLLTE